MNEDLEPLNPLAARSFWLMLAGFLVSLANNYGYYPATWFGFEAGDSASLVDLLLPAILILGAYLERRAPSRRLTFTGPLK